MNGEQSAASAASVAPSNTQYPPSLSNRASPFPSATTTTSVMATMAAPVFAPQTSNFRPSLDAQSSYKLGMGVAAAQVYDREANKPIGTPFRTAPSPPAPAAAVIIRGLPLNTSEESLRLMAVFSKELMGVQMLAVEADDQFRSAVMNFKSQAGAHQARDILHGKSNITNDAELSVDLLSGNSASARRFTVDAAASASSSAVSSAASSSGPNSRQQSRFNGTFQSMEKISPPMNGMYATGASNELPTPESSARYQSIFSPQSPIGNHLTERSRMSGKKLIADVVDDEDTGELLKDPVAYAESGATAQRRATAPQLPISSRMAGLSLNTVSQGPPPMPPYGHAAAMSAMSAHSATMSPIMGGGAGRGMDFQSRHFAGAKRHNYPPANPADQNPPCNTLYVGNLPIDTSEEELKAMFSKQRGYKRLCFRTKQNGPMCFVEFEDVSFATKALHELYGQPLHNSVKGGIRLSFSKNPLGVRSGQTPGYGNTSSLGGGMNGMMPGSNNSFSSANGPPPGLSAPPGLPSRMTGNYGTSTPTGNSSAYTVGGAFSSSANGWGQSTYGNSPVTAGGPGPVASNSNGPNYLPPHMMGR